MATVWNDPEHPMSHLERHERDLNVLHRIAGLLSTQSGQREILAHVLDTLEQELCMARCTLMLLTPDGNELVVETARESDVPEGTRVRYQRGEGIMGRVLQTGQPAIVPRIDQEPDFQDRIHRRAERGNLSVSFICVPVSIGNMAVGALAVDMPYGGQDTLTDAERVLTIVASMIANDLRARQMNLMMRERLEAENLRLRSALGERFRPENIIGESEEMRTVYQRIHQVAGSDTRVLVRGESGTGKELVASAIHYSSTRAAKPFVKVNCSALSEGLIESELFGHERGAFTGALYARKGRIEEAEGGTLFFDEIGDFSPAIQVKLLRVLQEREFERVGSNETRKTDVRIIAATNRDLEKLVQEGSFRQDLYYRVNVFSIHLPPLRQRRNDILLLADHFVQIHAAKLGKEVHRISTPAINMMLAYHWPGNVRELQNCIEHALLLSTDGVIHGQNLPPSLQMPDTRDAPPAGSLKARTQLLEKEMIIDGLKRHQGNVSAVARELGITPRMVRYKAKSLKIDPPRSFRKK